MADDGDGEPDVRPEDLDDLGDLDEPDDDDEDGDEEEAPARGKSDEEWKPPTRAEWERSQKRLKRYAKERREAGGGSETDRELQRRMNGGKGDDADEDAAAEAAHWRTAAARGQAAAQLAAAGFNGGKEQQRKLTRLLELDRAKPDREGNFDFEDEIEELKEDFPELFGARGTRRNERRTPAPGNRGDRGGTPQRTPTQRTTDKLLREAGFR